MKYILVIIVGIISEGNIQMIEYKEELINKLVDIEFSSPNNIYPKWLIKLELEEQ